jgi:hypothetical protein
MSEATGAGPSEGIAASGDAQPRAWDKFGRWGSIFRSYDFEISLPVSVALGALPAWITAVANGAVPLLIAFGGALAAVGSLVIVAITLFVALISPEYLVIIENLRGGVRGAVRPYYIVVLVSMTGVVLSFAAALAWPAIPAHGGSGVFLRWLTFAVPTLFASWGILGTIQLVALGNLHIEERARLAEALRQIRSLRRGDPKLRRRETKQG